MIKVNNIVKEYTLKKTSTTVLKGVNINFPKEKFIILLGKSGSGKSTLLNIISGLLSPTSGEVIFYDSNLYSLTNKQLSEFRKDNIGFVFQDYFLDKNFSAVDNVSIPLFLNKKLTKLEIREKAKDMLCEVGLEDKLFHKSEELSGGECQRVAIARALVNNPKIIVADEPTGNLDSVNGDNIINLLKQQVKNKKTVIMVTHNNEYTKHADIVYRMKDGVLVDNELL